MREHKNFWDRNAGRYDRFMRKDRAAYEKMYGLIRPVVKGKTVLELATGTGLIAKNIVNAAAHIEATDASVEMIAEAKRNNQSAKLHFSVQDMFCLPYADKSFDVVIVSKPAGALMMAGPQVLASAMKKDIKAEELGGADVAVKTGAAHFACETEADAMAKARAVLGMLPANNIEDAPFSVEEDMNRRLEGFEAGCDGAELIAALADTGSVLEFGKGHTQAVTALGKMAGRTVAFVYTGKGDTCDNRMKKIARFVRFADCYNIPVVSLVDSTGLKLFDTVERQMAVLNAASTLVYAYSEATTVKVTLVIGNAIGSAYVAMGGSANANITYAWQGSVISPMTGEAAIQIMWKDKIMASKGDAVKAREELAAQYEAEVADGVNAAVEGLVDDVIDPADSRKMVIAALEILSSKRDSNPPKKHGNMPL